MFLKKEHLPIRRAKGVRFQVSSRVLSLTHSLTPLSAGCAPAFGLVCQGRTRLSFRNLGCERGRLSRESHSIGIQTDYYSYRKTQSHGFQERIPTCGQCSSSLEGTFSPTVTIRPPWRDFSAQGQLPHLKGTDSLIIELNVCTEAISS